MGDRTKIFWFLVAFNNLMIRIVRSVLPDKGNIYQSMFSCGIVRIKGARKKHVRMDDEDKNTKIMQNETFFNKLLSKTTPSRAAMSTVIMAVGKVIPVNLPNRIVVARWSVTY